MFSIPKNINRNLWIDILGLPLHIPKYARICSDHFTKESFDKTNQLVRLKLNALPFKEQNEEMEERERREDCFDTSK